MIVTAVLYTARLQAMLLRAKHAGEVAEMYGAALRDHLERGRPTGRGSPAVAAPRPQRPSIVRSATGSICMAMVPHGQPGKSPTLRGPRRVRGHARASSTPLSPAQLATIALPAMPQQIDESADESPAPRRLDPITRDRMGGAGGGGWWWRSTTFLASVAGAVTMLLMVPVAVVTAVHPSTVTARRSSCLQHNQDTVIFLYIVMFGAVVAFQGRRFSAIVEVFRLREEVVRVAVACAVVAALYAPWVAIPSAREFDEDVGISLIFSGLLPAAVLYLTTVWPLRLAARERKAMRRTLDAAKDSADAKAEGGAASLATLDGTLANPAAKKLFLRHATLEFNAENPIFFEEAKRYRAAVALVAESSGSDDRDRNGHAHAKVVAHAAKLAAPLYEQYVREGAPLQVNLPSEVARSTEMLVVRLDYEVQRCLEPFRAADAAGELASVSSSCVRGTGRQGRQPAWWQLPERRRRSSSSVHPSHGTASVSASRTRGAAGHMRAGANKLTRHLAATAKESWPANGPGTPHMSAAEIVGIFDGAGEAVHALMAADSFPRFLASAAHQRLVEEMVRTEAEHAVLSVMGLETAKSH